jgi:hypothetical protein
MENKIGRSEWAIFPDFSVKLKAKIDTGAYGIALHVDGLEIKDEKLNFWIGNQSNLFTFDKFKKITVKSSFGRKQERFSIYTKIIIGRKSYKVFVSLTNRKNMKYPVLIGRRFLKKFNYIVDVSKKNINGSPKKM